MTDTLESLRCPICGAIMPSTGECSTLSGCGPDAQKHIESLRAQLASSQAALVESEARVANTAPFIACLSGCSAMDGGPCDCGAEEAQMLTPSAALEAHTQAAIRKALEDAVQRVIHTGPLTLQAKAAAKLLDTIMGTYAKSPDTKEEK